MRQVSNIAKRARGLFNVQKRFARYGPMYTNGCEGCLLRLKYPDYVPWTLDFNGPQRRYLLGASIGCPIGVVFLTCWKVAESYEE